MILPEYPALIQVYYNFADPHTRYREITALTACMKELGRKEGWVLTMNEEEEINVAEGKIHVIPTWKWMIE
jgi:predicted AAA+ superfamily ATPase